MDDTLLFIPPCCVDKKLPKAVLQAPGCNLTFYTHGDVTMEKFYRAISCMIVDPHVMVLSMPTVANETLAFLCQCFEREWITHLVLTSGNNAAKLVDRHLSDFRNRMLYVVSEDANSASSHMVLYNNRQALTLNGPMYARFTENRLTAYSLHFMPRHPVATTQSVEWGNVLCNALFPDALRHRQALIRNKARLSPGALDKFVHLEFPPYKDDDE